MTQKWLVTDVSMIVEGETISDVQAAVPAIEGWNDGAIPRALLLTEITLKVLTTRETDEDEIVSTIGAVLEVHAADAYIVKKIEPDEDQAALLKKVVEAAFDVTLSPTATTLRIMDVLAEAGYPR